eukprot:scaffold2469_cov48-Prasinocladus_malaysianus.AAC.1
MEALGQSRQADSAELRELLQFSHNGCRREKPVRKFFDKLLKEFPKEVRKASGELKKATDNLSGEQRRREARDKADMYNVLGGSYQRLTSKYTVGKMLGEGGFGKVYEVVEKSTGKVWACKEQDKVQLLSHAGFAPKHASILMGHSSPSSEPKHVTHGRCDQSCVDQDV